MEKPPRVTTPVLLWLSETLLDLGAALMSFALGVWIFQKSGSADQYSWTIVAAAVPTLLMTPLTGALVDWFDRRWLIVICDITSVLMIGLLAWLAAHVELTAPRLYLFIAGSAIVGSVRAPAYSASLSVMVSGHKLTQLSGLIDASQRLLQIGAPLLAGYLMGAVGLDGVIVIEVIIASIGTATVFTTLSRVRHVLRGVWVVERLPILQTSIASFISVIRYFMNAPLMASLAAYGVLQDGLLVLVGSLLIPLVLSTRSSTELGTILTCGALGGLAGSVLIAFSAASRRPMLWMLLGNTGLSLFVLLAGFATSVVAWGACAFLAFLCGSASSVCARSLWLRKTPVAMRGSILALLNSSNLLVTCIVMLAGGAIGEHILEPALATGGPWAETVGVWIGTGKGRGLALIFIICGATALLVSLLVLTRGRFRRLDGLLPDQSATT